MYCAYLGLLFTTVQTEGNYILALAYISLIAMVRYFQRVSVCHLAASSWNLNKTVADYMYSQKNESVFDPATMEGCNYLVDWPVSKSKFDASTSYATQLTVGDHDEEDKIIDIGMIWGCKDKSLSPELKDACLSFSLFHLLRRRFFGFACDESKDKARDFVLKGLLSDGAMDYNRVFKVIEVELAFMYDFFFTKYAVIYYGSVAATVWSLISVIGISITAYITARAPLKISQGDSVIASTVVDDVIVTLVILASTALLEFVQLLVYWMGIWSRVSFVCQYIREETALNRMDSQRKKARKRGSCRIVRLKGFLANVGVSCASNNHYWRHKLEQYSLLDSISCNPRPSVFPLFRRTIVSELGWRVLYLLDLAVIRRRNNQAWQARRKAGKSVELPDEVKKAVICSLRRTGCTLSNGRSSLELNGAQHLLWACDWEMHPEPSWSQRNQNQTHIILTWHIATWYCEMATLSTDREAKTDVRISIATKLSQYCAYLVVSLPKLLPGHPSDTTSKFDAAVVEAITLPPKSTSMYEAVQSLKVPQEPKTIFESGVKLGKQLEELEEVDPWQVMADFWAEMLLYLAPSDNVKEHIEQLTQGGEFITHLWALLSHAGILNRDQEHQAGKACNQHRADSFVSTASYFCQCECV